MPTRVKSFGDLYHYKLEENCLEMTFKRRFKVNISNTITTPKESRNLNLLKNKFMNRSVDKVLPTNSTDLSRFIDFQ
jgi:hypothetical protein